jgi:exosortase sorting signal-containing protein
MRDVARATTPTRNALAFCRFGIALRRAAAHDARAIDSCVNRFVVTSGRMGMASGRMRLFRELVLGASLLVAASLASGQTFLGPSPYLSQADSPFAASITAGTTFLETFESGALTTPGVTASTGTVVGPSGITDSVDGDDGAIDGSGTGGHSFFSGDGATGITFTFDAGVLGHLPTQVGIVWTDGAGTTTFEAFGPGGVSLGQIGPVAIADGSISGTTAEDRFFGVTNAAGISAIHISNTSGGIEVDHLQYGVFNAAPPPPPPPTITTPIPTLSEGALALLALVAAAFGVGMLGKRRA